MTKIEQDQYTLIKQLKILLISSNDIDRVKLSLSVVVVSICCKNYPELHIQVTLSEVESSTALASYLHGDDLASATSLAYCCIAI